MEFFPSLDAILTCFGVLLAMQGLLEESLSPTIHIVLPWLERAKKRLETLSSVISTSSEFTESHSFVQELARCTLKVLERIEVHGMWISGCLLHPGLRSF